MLVHAWVVMPRGDGEALHMGSDAESELNIVRPITILARKYQRLL
jgi:hypothetical protein